MACESAPTWAGEHLVDAKGVVIADDDDALDLRITDEVRAAP